VEFLLVLPARALWLRLHVVERLILYASQDSFMVESPPSVLVIDVVVPCHKGLLSLGPALEQGPECQTPQSAKVGWSLVLLILLRVQTNVHPVVSHCPGPLAAEMRT